MPFGSAEYLDTLDWLGRGSRTTAKVEVPLVRCLLTRQHVYAWYMQSEAGESARDVLERVERELTRLVRRAQRVHLHTEGPVQPLERSAYTILGFLHDEGPMRNAALAALLHLDASTVSRQVAALQRAGLIAREVDPDDGRACRLRLTPGGQRAVASTRLARRSALRELIGSWPEGDQQALAVLLERLNAGLDAKLVEAAAESTGVGEPASPGAGPSPTTARSHRARPRENAST